MSHFLKPGFHVISDKQEIVKVRQLNNKTVVRMRLLLHFRYGKIEYLHFSLIFPTPTGDEMDFYIERLNDSGQLEKIEDDNEFNEVLEFVDWYMNKRKPEGSSL